MSSRRVLLRWALACIVFTGVYVGSFVALRQEMSITFFRDRRQGADLRLYSVRVYYFSRESRTNAMLVLAYFPLHWDSQPKWPMVKETLGDGYGDRLRSAGIRYVYARDIEPLRAMRGALW